MKELNSIKRFSVRLPIMLLSAILSLSLVSCDEHEPIDLGIHPGHILLADGNVKSADDYFSDGDSTAVGVIFSELIDDDHYLAVMLHELPSLQFCDSLTGMKQGTSCSLTAMDGRENTIALWSSYDSKSGRGCPLANATYYGHEYSQSDFIPSVAEMEVLYSFRFTVNRVIDRLNKQRASYAAVPLSLDRTTDACWYWTSTEVKDTDMTHAWLFSMNSGIHIETPKLKDYHARKISVYYPHNNHH